MRVVAALLVLLLAGCAAKPSKEELERAREIRVTQLRIAMNQTEGQLGAARSRIAEAKKMKNANDRAAEIASGERELQQFTQQKNALQAELSAVMKATEAEE